MLKSVLFFKSVCEYLLFKQQVTSDQSDLCVFRQQSFADIATLVVIVTAGVCAVV
jgi:hypothetical protein